MTASRTGKFGIDRDTNAKTSGVFSVLTVPTYAPPIEKVPLQPIGSIIQLRDSTNRFYRSTKSKWDSFVQGTDITLTSVGTGVSLVDNGVGPSLTVKSLSAGVGINIIENLTDVVIDNAGVITISVSPSTGTSLLATSSTAQNVVIRSLVAGDGILISSPSEL